jgi:tRNA pseudouridine32 synthase/23S rRNA pseudouridine746 synthase
MLPILYEDDDIVAVDKPEGLAAIPERNKERDSVFSLLSSRYEQRLRVVHRIDKHTSGVLVFAKNRRTNRFLGKQFENRTVQKTYLALVHGVVEKDSGVIDKPLRQFGSGRVAVDTENGRPSVTKYEVVKRLDCYTLVEAYPVTGRLHQIRVHFYSIGHPVVGDWLYGDMTIQLNFNRLMLHAKKITFDLPVGQELTLRSPLSESFLQILTMVTKP